MLSVFVVVDITPSCVRQALAYREPFYFYFFIPQIIYLYESSSYLKFDNRTFLPGNSGLYTVSHRELFLDDGMDEERERERRWEG